MGQNASSLGPHFRAGQHWAMVITGLEDSKLGSGREGSPSLEVLLKN